MGYDDGCWGVGDDDGGCWKMISFLVVEWLFIQGWFVVIGEWMVIGCRVFIYLTNQISVKALTIPKNRLNYPHTTN